MFAEGKNYPVLISVGHDPLQHLSSANEVRPGISEFSHAGGHRGRPFEVIQSEIHGLPNIKGVWCIEFGGGRLFNVISIKQFYAGHAKQALLLDAGDHGGNYIGRFVVVVDEDIDPSDVWSVMWAISSRCYPDQDIDIVRNTWTGSLDPRKKAGNTFNSRALIDACRPFDWRDEFPHVAESSPEPNKKTLEKFG